jgi:hypothetical protein
MPSKKALDQLGLAGVFVAQRPDAQLVALAQAAGDRDDALQMRRQEIVALVGAPHRQQRGFGVGVVRRQVVEQARAGHVRHGLDVEGQRGFGHQAGKTPVEM